jgi:UDPglucose--hexose-1-phosphate uridylyltransferase
MTPRPPELRYDSLTGEWVGIAGSRNGRPNLPATDCPFCVGGLEAPATYQTKAFANRWPMYAPGDPVELDPASGHGPARGASEIVLYSPEHESTLATMGTAAVRRVVDLWADRTEELLARPEIEYVLVFENRGAEAGATIPHPHGQIYAFPFLPPVPRREAELAEAHGCQLCRQGDEEADGPRVVSHLDGWLAYVPYASAWPYGALIVPEEQVAGLPELGDDARNGLATMLGDVLARYDRRFARRFPYMLWIHPGVHLHVHVAPPLRARDTMRWVAAGELGSGTFSNPVEPERAADELRRA